MERAGGYVPEREPLYFCRTCRRVPPPGFWQHWWWCEWPVWAHDYYGRLLFQRLWTTPFYPDYYGNCTFMRCENCQLAYEQVALLQDHGFPVVWQEWEE